MRMSGNKLPWPVMLALMLIVLIGSGFLSPAISFTSPSAFAATTLKGDELKGKVVTSSGRPIADAHVQLISPANTMMDITTTSEDGKFTLDLGVLEDDELKELDKFLIVVSKDGKKVKKGLDSGASSADDVITIENITLPYNRY